MLLTQSSPFEQRQPLSIKLPDIGCPIELRRSSRTKRFTLKVSHTGRAAILTLPDQGRIEEAGDFLARHFDWLKRQVQRLPEPVPLADGEIVPLRGVPHRLDFVGPIKGHGVVWTEYSCPEACAEACLQEASSAAAFSPPLNDPAQLPRLCVTGANGHVPRRLLDWLKTEARMDLVERVSYHAARLDCQPNRLSVRDQATRWGSCTSTGRLSFSWRLIFAPAFVLDYVAAHEVAHLKEMNHGPRFWRVVKQTLPDMQKGRSWLKKNGAELHRFAAPA